MCRVPQNPRRDGRQHTEERGDEHEGMKENVDIIINLSSNGQLKTYHTFLVQIW